MSGPDSPRPDYHETKQVLSSILEKGRLFFVYISYICLFQTMLLVLLLSATTCKSPCLLVIFDGTNVKQVK